MHAVSETGALPHYMSLLDEARMIATKFDYTDSDVRKCVAQFVFEMSRLSANHSPQLSRVSMSP